MLNLITPLYPTYLIHNNKTLYISYNDGSIHGYNISLSNKQAIIQLPEANEYVYIFDYLFIIVSDVITYQHLPNTNPISYMKIKDCKYITSIILSIKFILNNSV